MKRLLLLGTGPLLEEGTTVMSGQCLRTWHFAKPLLDAGFRVRLLTVPIPGATDEQAPDPLTSASYQGFEYGRFVSNNQDRLLPVLAREIETFRPDGLVGINQWPSWLLAKLGSEKPLWADLNGWTLGEGLVRAVSVGHDNDFPHFWRMESLVALKADFFSTVTARQAWALEGELALLGRLDRTNAAKPLATVVPNAVYPLYEGLPRQPGVPSFLADRLPADAAIVLWSGGFNSWTDIDMLAEGLARAMAEEPRLCFVATGGPVIGHDEAPWKRWEQARARLPEGRCLTLGWVDLPLVLELHVRAAVGLNIDGTNIETRFGARNRLTNMLGCGLPVVTTRGTEIAEWIERGGHGSVVQPGDAGGLAAALVAAVRDSPRVEAIAARARRAALEEFSAPRTLLPFFEWAADPRRAPRSDSAALQRIQDWMMSQAANPLPFAPPPPDTLRRKLARRLRRLLG